jgi:hypothetical protein
MTESRAASVCLPTLDAFRAFTGCNPFMPIHTVHRRMSAKYVILDIGDRWLT